MLDNIKIILVEPAHPGNIGGAARAMKTMGITQLVLVNPLRFPDPQADWRAAGAVDVVDQATVVTDLSEALANCQFVLGTSTRMRSIPWPVISARQVGEILSAQAQSAEVAVVFGREDSGLSNEELRLCHTHLQIPSSPVYGSLNLAMAVQVVCYEIYQYVIGPNNLLPSTRDTNDMSHIHGLGERIWDRPPASMAQMEGMMDHLEQVLYASGFVDPDQPGNTVSRLRRVFMRQQLDDTEIQILRGMLKHISARME